MSHLDGMEPTGPVRRAGSLVPGLTAASCAYLGVPYLFFFAGWLRWWLALPATAALVLCCVAAVRGARRPAAPLGAPRAPAATWRGLVLLAAVCLGLTSLSGAGGVGLQEGDYFKHNAVLKQLIERPWPAVVDSGRGPFPLVYYTAWYLPAAAVGKLGGWTAANGFLFGWSAAGLVLSVLWFAVLAGRLNWIVIGVFALFSAPDVVGAAVLKLAGVHYGPAPPPPVLDAWGIDWNAWRWWNWEIRWWAGPYTWNYCANVELVFWVPQQALGAWISTGMAVAGLLRGGDAARRCGLVPAALSALWSPLVTAGLVPLAAVDLLAGRRPAGTRVRAWVAWPNLGAVFILGIMALYYAARAGAMPFTNEPLAEFRFLGFDDWSAAEYLVRLVFFLLVDVGAVAGLIWAVRPPRGRRSRALFWIAVALLAALALFRYGMNNDLGMRVSMPSLFVLAVFLAKAALDAGAPRARRLVLVGALAVMAATPVSEVYRFLCEMRRRGQWVAVPHEAEVRSLWELSCETRDESTGNDFFFRQYVGSPDSFFFRRLARPAPPGEEP